MNIKECCFNCANCATERGTLEDYCVMLGITIENGDDERCGYFDPVKPECFEAFPPVVVK